MSSISSLPYNPLIVSQLDISSGSGSSVASVNGQTGVVVLTAADISLGAVQNVTSCYAFKNRLINGNFNINQRYASGPATLTNGVSSYFADQWIGKAIGNDTIATTGINGGLAVAGASSITEVDITQRVESYSCVDMSGAAVTLSFITQLPAAGSVSYGVSYATVQDVFSSVTPITSGTFALANTNPKQCSATFTMPTDAQNGVQLTISAGALSTGLWNVSNVQLELAPQATVYDLRPIDTERRLCQRYYYRSWGDGNFVDTGNTIVTFPIEASLTNSIGSSTFPMTMRATPTVVLYDEAGTSGSCSQPGYVTGIPAEASRIGPTGFGWIARNDGGSFATVTPVKAHYTASAVL